MPGDRFNYCHLEEEMLPLRLLHVIMLTAHAHGIGCLWPGSYIYYTRTYKTHNLLWFSQY